MSNRTFKVVDTDCDTCLLRNECNKITGISRDDIYQSLKDAKLYSFIDCKDNGAFEASLFMEVKEELQ